MQAKRDSALPKNLAAEIERAKSSAVDTLSSVFNELKSALTKDTPPRTVPLFFPQGIETIEVIVKIGADKSLVDFEVKIHGPNAKTSVTRSATEAQDKLVP